MRFCNVNDNEEPFDVYWGIGELNIHEQQYGWLSYVYSQHCDIGAIKIAELVVSTCSLVRYLRHLNLKIRVKAKLARLWRAATHCKSLTSLFRQTKAM